ncbi:MAG TPA: DUF2243 domain-containing protein [Chthoniobacterales bacterium]|nr:DUF2243 domain-containing protein [Chthoniobacterales bacterium]
MNGTTSTPDHRPLVVAGTFLGVGLGGFLDGILLHQLLQTHNMLSATVPKTSIPNMEINMFWDGVFHSLTWVMTLIGVVLFWKAGKRRESGWSGKVLAGAMFLGWGLFNFVEGVIDHYLLGIHHVAERLGLSAFDHAFLASGVLFIACGWLAIRSARDARERNPAA